MREAPPFWTPLRAAIAVFLLLVLLLGLRHDNFLSPRVAVNLLSSTAVLGIAAIGAAFVIQSGGVDLSVGAVVALASVSLAGLIGGTGLPPAVAIPAVLVGGTLFGAGMGWWIHHLEVPPFIVTLGGMFLARGVALWVAPESIAIDHPHYRWLTTTGLPLGSGLRLPVTAILLVGSMLVGSWISRHTRLGRNALALGGSEESARLLGVPVRATRLGVYALSGLCSALAGVAFTLCSSSGNSIAGVGLELEAIAAAVVGGVSLAGGVGTIPGAVLGVLLFGVIQTGIDFEGTLGAGWTRVAIGGLLLAFIALQRLLDRKGGES
jgi:galactofuranose transport system permease protein